MPIKNIFINCHGKSREMIAAAVINPGDLIVTNGVGKAVLNITGNADILRMVARENTINGQLVYDADGVLNSYAIGDRVYARILASGDMVNVSVEAGQAIITIGDPIVVKIGGSVRKATSTTVGGIIGYADETVDNSAGLTKTHIAITIK